MLRNKKIKSIAIATSLIAASVVLGFNCSPFGATVVPSIDSQSASQTGGPQIPAALLSSEQMLKAMISATGTEGLGDIASAEDDLINKTYDERTGSLPSGQDVSLITGPTLISVTNLASSVCAKAVDRDRATSETQRDDRLFFREMDFSKGLSSQSSEGVSMAFERIARNAWRRDVSSAELENIVQFAREYTAETDSKDLTNPAQTRLLAISVCTAVLSSIDALTY